MVRLAAYGGLSCVLASYVVLSAFRQRSNYFSAAVYLSKSNACMMILWNFGVFLTILLGRALQTVFFGPLRLIEVERLHERAWYAVTESLLALTIFREEFDTSFVILFVSLLFLKVFHWLAADRVEMMEQSPSIPRIFHLRMVAVFSALWVIDFIMIAFAADAILTEGPSVMIMFASEYMIMLAILVGVTLKYAVNVYDLRSEIPWENKSVFVFYIDLACDFLKLATYLCFFSLILTFYGLPLNILRDVYITARSFVLKVRDLARYRQATRNMDERYPNATPDELERMSDRTCIICREDMEARTADQPQNQQQQQQQDQQNRARGSGGRSAPNDTPKKLPCGHIFHFHCLRSWLERQQSCPTCRRPVLSGAPSTTQQQQQHAGAQQPAAPGGQAQAPPPLPQPGAVPRVDGQAAAAPAPTPTDRHNASASMDPSRRSSSRSGEGSSHRLHRRAGMDNPLVAFQASSLSLRPTTTQHPEPAVSKEGESRDASVAEGTQGKGPTDASTARVPASSMPGLSVQTPTSQTPNESEPPRTPVEMDERAQRRQRMEAAARLRQAASAISSSSLRSAVSPINAEGVAASSGPAPPEADMKRHALPTPTIKVNDVAASTEDTSNCNSADINLAQQLATEAESPSKTIPADTQAQSGSPSLSKQAASSSTTEHDSVTSHPPDTRPIASIRPRTRTTVPPPPLLPAYPSYFPRFNNLYAPPPVLPDPIAGVHHPAGPTASYPNELPRLIPLFDPSDPTRASPLARLIPALYNSQQFQSTLDELRSASSPSASVATATPQSAAPQENDKRTTDPPRLPDNLSQEQLSSLARITKDGLEAQMKLIQNTQETLQTCMNQLQEAISVIPTADVHGMLKVAAEVGASTAPSTQENKGKGRASN